MQLISIHYWKSVLEKQMIRGRTMWDQTDGCAKQYMCSIAYNLMSYLSTSYQIIIDTAVDKPVHGMSLIPKVKYRMNSLTTIVPYPWKVDV